MVAKFWLEPVALERAGGFSRVELNAIVKLVQAHGERLLRSWQSSLVVEVQEARAQSVALTDDALTVDLVDGRTIIVPLVWFPRLWHGTPQERKNFEIFGDGAYLHWPELDEDLTVAGLLAGRRSGESPRSLSRWLNSRSTVKKGAGRKPARG